MSRKILNNGDSGLEFREKLNDNFKELFDTARIFVATHRAAPEFFTITTTPTTIPFSDTVAYQDNMTYDPVTGIFTNVYKGIYIFDFFMSGNWGNGVEITLTAWRAGVQLGAGVTLTGQGATKNIPLGIPTFNSLDANDTLELKAHIETGSTTLELVNGSVNLALKVATA